TLKPAGTRSCALAGLATTCAEFLTDGVANGSANLGNCAVAVVQRPTKLIKRRIVIDLVVISVSRSHRKRCKEISQKSPRSGARKLARGYAFFAYPWNTSTTLECAP